MLLNAMEQKRLRSFRLTKHLWFMMRMKKWTWQKTRDEIRNARVEIKTSGFFNAGLTPCSHTTTTTKMSKSPSLGFLVMSYYFNCFIVTLFYSCLFLVIGCVIINTLPGVSNHHHSLVVVVCEHGVSPALNNPEVFKASVSVSSFFLFFCHVHFFIIVIKFLRSRVIKTSQSYLFHGIKRRFTLRNRINLHLGIEIIYT